MLKEISTQIDTNTISLSSAAAQAVQNILAEKNLEGADSFFSHQASINALTDGSSTIW